MKRFLSFLAALCMLFSLCVGAAAAEQGSFSNFRAVNTYSYDSFADVSGWYAPYVSTVYTLGLMQGTTNAAGERVFQPGSMLSLAETVTLACRIHSTYFGQSQPFAQSSPWYQTYIDYAVEQGILSSAGEFDNYNREATRGQFAAILARSLPDAAYTEINTVELGAISDVDMNQSYALSVYKLYRAGILTGGDGGDFSPDASITRSEAAAIVGRIVQPASRQSFTLYAPLYVGFTKDSENEGAVGITDLTMTTEGSTCYLTMDFQSQRSRFLSIMDASGSLYLLKVVVIDPGVDHFTFAFPMETLEKIYASSNNPSEEKIIMEFYANGDPSSVMDRFYISIDQFAKYFSTAQE